MPHALVPSLDHARYGLGNKGRLRRLSQAFKWISVQSAGICRLLYPVPVHPFAVSKMGMAPFPSAAHMALRIPCMSATFRESGFEDG